ncbi:MAG TPA: DUF5018 domain-containing protein [Phnomibacter sp.]|nr:DUF5018 domain-containing protein [Phnomibacter sp.]
MKFLLASLSMAVLLAVCPFVQLNSQTILIDHNFQTTTLPAGVTSNGTLNPTKAADGVCSKGMVQVNSGQYLQVDVASCSFLMLNMKSTSTAARNVKVSYQKDGETVYTVLTSTLSVLAAASFELHTLFPAIITSSPISIKIEPLNGNIQVHDLLVKGNSTVSNAAEITSFKMASQIGTEQINSSTGAITIQVPTGTALSNVAPLSIGISSSATISPLATAPQNFAGGNPVNYTVTAQDGTTTKNWTVTVQSVASAAKEITAFKLMNNQIGNAVIQSAAGTITVNVPIGEDISAVVPQQLTISNAATISPLPTTAQNFNSPVVYTVTAEDNSTKQWTVTVNAIDPNAVYTDYEAEQADFTGVTDNKHAGYSGTGFIDFAATGENYISFLVCQQQAGVQTAKFRYAFAKAEVRSGNLFVNGSLVGTLAFTPTATFTDWVEEQMNVTLVQGINSIKIVWDNTDGPNLDKLSLSGAVCPSYPLAVTTTNSGKVEITPERKSGKYFTGETVTLSAQNSASLLFQNWSGDATGTTNPVQVIMNSAKSITANFTPVTTYTLQVNVQGLGEVQLSPAGGVYATGTLVTLTAQPVLGSTFQSWGGALSGNQTVQTITVNANTQVSATFTNSVDLNFNKVVGFASISGDGFTGPTTGGSGSTDTVFINGPAEFGKLCQVLQDRIQYKYYSRNPLTIVLEEGTYTGTGGQLSVWANSMLTIQEQGDLTIIGRRNVVLNFGINVKRSYNLIIRNISFRDYYDDGINIGEDETHHIWVDHCTVGSPLGMPADSEHPDGGIDVKTGASYVTISWTKYQNSWKTGLIGHSDNNSAQDNGRLKVTHFANHFYNTNSRNPRVRFGEVHVLNCLHDGVKLYGIAASNNSSVVAENNFFLNTRWPMYADRALADFKAVYGNNTDDVFTSKTGNYAARGLCQKGNAYDDSGLPVITGQINPAMLNPGGRSIKFDELNCSGIFDPHTYYNYDPFPASAVRVLVPMYAGADKVDFFALGNGVLPLKLIAFTAKPAASKVVLNWKTSNETGVSHFDIERSADGVSFSGIGKQSAFNQANYQYSFVDELPLSTNAYYRLKMVDKDGKYSHSSVVLVKAGEQKAELRVYPNPAHASLQIEHALVNQKGVAQLLNLEGKVIRTVLLAAQSRTSTFNLTGIAPGMYMLRVETDGVSVMQKVWKQ